MAAHICLSVLFSYFIILPIVSTLAQSDNYIIHMDISAMPKAFSSHHSWYLSTLSSALLDNSKSLTTNNHNSISSKLIYSYTNAMTGFSANLSPKELEALKASPGYISSIKDIPAKIDTTHSPQFLGLKPNVGAWPRANFGKDVIIGLVDSGIWPESESFKDEGMTNVPSRWKGQCENSIHFKSSLCNRKLIGAKFFNKGLLAKYPNRSIALNSTRDTDGHGTHTSSIAAGNRVEGVSYFGFASGTATGIAPHARIAMYKALWEDGSYSSDVIAAIDSAISDGVDVLSLSLGFGRKNLYDDPIAIATFGAIEKGIFVSTSAGNDGPDYETLHNGIPWVVTVAAGTLDREFQGSLTLGNGVKVNGLSLYHGNMSFNHVPMVFMGNCEDYQALKNVKDKLVVCEDNGYYDFQVSDVDSADIVTAVFITDTPDPLFALISRKLVAIILSSTNGEIVKAYTNSTKSDSKASMSFGMTVLGTKPAPGVDAYSSRGPSTSCPHVLKPDITAPGSYILAAWPPNVPAEEVGDIKYFNKFNLLTGTSMACPHVAGVGTLLRSVYPHWSPAAIRSAIITTSDIYDNTFNFIRDVAYFNSTADSFTMGAGFINPNRALDPGLVYDVGLQDYVNLMCAMNFTQKNISVITKSSSNDCSKPSLDLNYPSFIATLDGPLSQRTMLEFQRTVTNVGEGPTKYVASITYIGGWDVSVIPNKLVFKEKNEKLSYKLRIEVPKNEMSWKFGYLTWKDVKHVVRSPIVVITAPFD